MITINKLGHSFNAREDRHISFWKLVDDNQWEQNTFIEFKNYIKPNSVYIDIGAWIGPTVLFASKLTNNKCYALEPDNDAFSYLKGNIEINNSDIEIDKLAIMDYEGEVNLGVLDYGRGDSMSSVLSENNPDNLKVKCTTLKKYLEAKQINRVDFIKIDVEGAESIILPNIKDLIVSLGKPYIHLSIHQRYFKNRNEDIEKILDFSSLYDITEADIHSIRNSDMSDILLKRK